MVLFRLIGVVLALGLAPPPVMADDIQALAAVQPLKDEWAEVFYGLPAKQQRQQLEDFLIRARQLVQRYPQAAEPLLMEALVLCAQAGSDGGLGALSKVRDAREVLQRAIGLDPLAMEGSAYVMLGNLYYRLPGWPLSFGDDKLARQYLETALKYFPNEVDTNYFYGDFLLEQGEFDKAVTYLERAEQAPIRGDERLSDIKLKQELDQALKDARQRNGHRANFFSRFLSALKG